MSHGPWAIGWVDIGTKHKSTPDVCYIPFKGNKKKRKKCFDKVTASSLVKTFWDMHYIEVPTFFSQYGLYMNFILRRLKNINLPW
jgi:hypothetical protein